MRMKQKIILTGIACAVSLFCFATAYSEGFKWGYVIPQKVLSGFDDYVEAEKMFEEFKNEKNDELKAKEQKFKAEVENYQRQLLMLEEEAKKKEEQRLQQQQMILEKEVDDVYDPQNGLLAKKKMQLFSPILDLLGEVINKLGEEEDYDLILTAETNILYAKQENDLSDKVLDALKSESRKLSIPGTENKDTEDQKSEKSSSSEDEKKE